MNRTDVKRSLAETLASDAVSHNTCQVNLPNRPARRGSEVARALRREDLAENIVTLFNAKVQRTSTCWLWTASKDRSGYGFAFIGKKAGGRSATYFAHRLAYVFAHGSIPSGAVVMHACDNPSCVNPDHLSLGTQAQNAHDSKVRGRRAKVKPTIRKIDEAGVVAIRRNDRPAQEWADYFGVCVSHINRIRRFEKRMHG